MYAALALRHFGRDLKTNPLWQGLDARRAKGMALFAQPGAFYDPTNKVINLPENYLGVAAHREYQLRTRHLDHRGFLDKLLDRAAVQFNNGTIYVDDSPPTGRYDRYSNEYAVTSTKQRRWPAVKTSSIGWWPSLTAQMRLWWDLVSEDGYGYNWGRSQGVVSYLDTPEIVGWRVACGVPSGIACGHRRALLPGVELPSARLPRGRAPAVDLRFRAGKLCVHLARARVATDDRVFRQAREFAYADRERTRPRRCYDVSGCADIGTGCAV